MKSYRDEGPLSLPPELFIRESLEVLKLNCNLNLDDSIKKNPPNLKAGRPLHTWEAVLGSTEKEDAHDPRRTSGLREALQRHPPDDQEELCFLQSGSLKRLSICSPLESPRLNYKLNIKCPDVNIPSIFHGTIPLSYSIKKLEKLAEKPTDIDRGECFQQFYGIRQYLLVRVTAGVTFSSTVLKAAVLWSPRDLPTFRGLTLMCVTHLRVHLPNNFCSEVIPYLLKCFQDLEKLCVTKESPPGCHQMPQKFNFPAWAPDCLTSSLKEITFSNFRTNIQAEITLLLYFLVHGEKLNRRSKPFLFFFPDLSIKVLARGSRYSNPPRGSICFLSRFPSSIAIPKTVHSRASIEVWEPSPSHHLCLSRVARNLI
ncbi:hypothetical protein CRG98_031778 [Punica granatum]|uniref:FBD domain-containing protein n=1 Tax=Punica granatum TaxID=22663 RepID=A0A2I0IUZ8_PUNGR|nr:hypothetical protein CRG98_031778 [Punica granatum]